MSLSVIAALAVFAVFEAARAVEVGRFLKNRRKQTTERGQTVGTSYRIRLWDEE